MLLKSLQLRGVVDVPDRMGGGEARIRPEGQEIAVQRRAGGHEGEQHRRHERAAAADQGGEEESNRLLFVNEKKRKYFVDLGRAGDNAAGPRKQTCLRRFVQKADTCLSSG